MTASVAIPLTERGAGALLGDGGMAGGLFGARHGYDVVLREFDGEAHRAGGARS